MIARRVPTKITQAAWLAVCALALLAGSLAPRAAAQEFRLESAGPSAPVGAGAAAAVALPPAGGGLNVSAPSLLSAPSFALSAAPAATSVPNSAIGGEGTSALPVLAAAAPAAPRLNEESDLGVTKVATTLPAVARTIAVRAGAPRRLSDLAAAPTRADAAARTAEDGAAQAEQDFAALTGERLIGTRGTQTLQPSAVAQAAPRKTAALRPTSTSRLNGRFLAVVPVAAAIALEPGLRDLFHPLAATWQAVSQAGYVAGNAGAAIFPLFQIYETFKGQTTPRGRAIVGATASLALGLISAPILGKTLWGVQNVFGGITLLAPLLIGGWAKRVNGSGLKETALLSTAALAVSAGLYFAVAAALPGALAAAFSAAAVSRIALAVQFATSAMFLWMFLPDLFHHLRGKAAHGFSTGFSLMFFVSSAGSMLWALPSAFITADAHQGSYRMIFAINAIYAATSLLSYWFARREARPR
ncbi:MAG: hypothetical protein HKL90_11125 [Elusimicrobia bacterium]|nr:hypothetical protein [Elusimicrobiota bacterium]